MAAATLPFISIEEYLHTSYEPDADYVDGEIEERYAGEWDHSKLQKLITLALAAFEADGEYLVAFETRVQTSATRFRVPDICVIRAEDEPDRIVTAPPMLCIEVLSPEDRYSRVHARCQDYVRMGVPEVWIFDPETMAVDILRAHSSVRLTDGILQLEGTPIKLDLAELSPAMLKRKR